MRKREIRGYSRTSGIKLDRSSQMRNGGLAVLIIGFVMGICGLATTVTQRTDRLVAATTNQSAEVTSTVDTHANSPTATPATMLETIPVPSVSQIKPTPSKASANKKVATCSTANRGSVMNHRAQQIRAESKRHRDAMWSLQTTGVVAKFFNPYMYNKRLNQEVSAHRAILKQIQQNYTAGMTRAHCS